MGDCSKSLGSKSKNPAAKAKLEAALREALDERTTMATHRDTDLAQAQHPDRGGEVRAEEERAGEGKEGGKG
jgi:hypothetical protein